MTNLLKAAEQALEALEYYHSFEDCQPTPASKTIPALRQALAQPTYEFECPRCGHCCQQRQWVGLTGEEVKYLINHFDWRAPAEHFVSAIESKLKEKNA